MWIPAVLFAATVMSHLVVAIFAVIAGLIVWAVRRPIANCHPRRRDRRGGRAAHRGVAAAAGGHPRLHDRHALRADQSLLRLAVPRRELVPLPVRRSSRSVPGSTTAAARRSMSPRSRSRPGSSSTTGRGCASVFGKAPGVEPAPPAVLVPDAVPARRVGRRRAGAAHRARRHVGDPRSDHDDGGPPFERGTPGGDVRTAPSSRTPSSRSTLPERDRLSAWDATRVIAIALLAAIATTVALVRVDQTRDFLPYWAKYNYTGYESGSTDRLHRQVVARSTRRSSTPRTRSHPAAWPGRAATPSAPTARRSR